MTEVIDCTDETHERLRQAGLFKDLSFAEILNYQQWAYENYIPNEPIPAIWHPIIREECKKINKELFESIRL